MADNLFDRKEVATSGDIQLQNDMLEVYFDGSTGLLKSIKHLDFDKKRKMIACKLMFGAYTSAQFHSGAYLFMPEPNSRDFEKGMCFDTIFQMLSILKKNWIDPIFLNILTKFQIKSKFSNKVQSLCGRHLSFKMRSEVKLLCGMF